MGKPKLDFLDHAFLNIPLSPANQERLDFLLYGKKIEGAAPWEEGPKSKAFKKARAKWHTLRYGEGQKCPTPRCPVCKTDYTIGV